MEWEMEREIEREMERERERAMEREKHIQRKRKMGPEHMVAERGEIKTEGDTEEMRRKE